MSVSITALTRYQGKGSSSICAAMLYVAIVIVGTILCISSCVTIGTFIGATLGGLPGFLLYCVSIGISFGIALGCLPCFLCYFFYIGTSLGATLGGVPGFLFCVCTLGVCDWC